jgi:hypothetical protein
MSESKKEYDSEMRGALYEESERKGDKYPIATGKIQISGVELRIAMWPAQVSKGESKKKYWPLKVEYRQGATKFLVPVSPAQVVVNGATATAAAPGDGEAADVGDVQF